MRTWISIILALVGFSAAGAEGWPALPVAGFLSGRPATDKDVHDGNAIFVLKSDNIIIGKSLPIAIPQYAYLTENGGPMEPVIVVQAEEANGIKLFGYRDRGGKEGVAAETDLRLLGQRPPS